ncbi:MAG: BamA/TamA family outer membrane protein [Gracilimonas sp.]|nr:BamA/TamA family outer membrane protein [Gracilimonas sp.]
MITSNLKLLILLLFFFVFSSTAFGQELAEEDIAPRVWSLSIEGNKTFEGIVLRNAISNEPPSTFKKMIFWKIIGMRLNENEVRRDVIRLERFYQRRGFDDVIVSYRIEDLNKSWQKELIFEIVENQPIRIQNVNFSLNALPKDSLFIYDDQTFSRLRQNLPYKVGQRYETVNKTEIEGRLVGIFRNLGFPYAESSVEATIDSAAKRATVTFINTPGPRAHFDSLFVSGAQSLREKYILRETGIESGEVFSENTLREAQREVFNHHLFRFAIISIPDQPVDSSLNVEVRVKEMPKRSVQLQGGIGNLTRIDDGFADLYKLFRGQASWTHRSVRNRGERFNISGTVSAIEQRLSINYLFPYLYNTKTSLNLSPFWEHKLEPSYEIYRGGLNTSFLYQYSANLTGSISYEYSQNNESSESSQISLPDSIVSYNVSSFNLNGYYTKNLRRGRKGWSIQPFWDLSGLFGESTFSFQKAGVDTRKFTSLTDNIVWAKRLNLSGIYYSKQDSLPSDIRIYNGGTNSVRGWNRQELGPKRALLNDDGSFNRYVPVGGNATISFNTEFRFNLREIIKGFGVAAFLDGGQVWRNFGDIGSSPIQFGVGGGIRYQSPIGPIRVDLAYKVNPTNEDLRIYRGENFGSAWNRWGLHFSIGQAF